MLELQCQLSKMLEKTVNNRDNDKRKLKKLKRKHLKELTMKIKDFLLI